MSKYVIAFRGQADRSPQPEEEQQWGAWFAQLGPVIADFGNRVGATCTLPAQQHSDRATQVLTGYIVIAAEDLPSAAQLAGRCPGLAHGVSVEVAEVVEA